MTYSRGDILIGEFERHDPRRSPKKRYALVLSSSAYNDSHDHGVLAAIATNVRSDSGDGIHVIRDAKAIGLDDELSMVTPWLWTVGWHRVERKVGQMSPYEFGQVMECLREVVPL